MGQSEETSIPYDIPVVFIGKPAPGECIASIRLPRKVVFPPNFKDSQIRYSFQPSAYWFFYNFLDHAYPPAVFTVKSWGVTIGTITVGITESGGARINTFATVDGLEKEIDGSIEVYAPNPADLTLENIYITFAGVISV